MMELMAKLQMLEDELSSLRAEMARLVATPGVSGRPSSVRMARTYDTGSYPTATGDNTFPIEFVDATYTATAGNRTPTVTSRDTANIAIAHNMTDEKIPVDTLIPVIEYGDRWWTWYGAEAGEQTTDCTALQGLTGFDATVDQFLTSQSDGTNATCEWVTLCDHLESSLSTVTDDITHLIVRTHDGSSAGCGRATACSVLKGLTGWTSETWQMLVHDPNTVDSGVDDGCEWYSVCDFLGEALGTVTSGLNGYVIAETASGCGWAAICDVLNVIANAAGTPNKVFGRNASNVCGWYDPPSGGDACTSLKSLGTYDEAEWMLLGNDPGSPADPGDGTCTWFTFCDFISSALSNVSANITHLVVKTSDPDCGLATLCDVLQSQTGWVDDSVQLLVHNGKTADSGIDDTCEWMTPCELYKLTPGWTADTWQILQHNPGSSGGADDSCQWVSACDVLKRVAGWTNETWQVLVHDPNTDDLGVDDTCEWYDLCDFMDAAFENQTNAQKVFGKKSDGTCGWFDPGSGDYCTMLTQYATENSLATANDWIVKLHHDGTSWTCVPVKVGQACA